MDGGRHVITTIPYVRTISIQRDESRKSARNAQIMNELHPGLPSESPVTRRMQVGRGGEFETVLDGANEVCVPFV